MDRINLDPNAFESDDDYHGLVTATERIESPMRENTDDTLVFQIADREPELEVGEHILYRGDVLVIQEHDEWDYALSDIESSHTYELHADGFDDAVDEGSVQALELIC